MSKKISSKYLKLNKEDLKKRVLKARKKYIPKIPSYISKKFQVDELVEGGHKCYRIVPQENFGGKYIVYLYGSGMCNNISEKQWEFIYKLAIKTGAGLFVPMYPLAPEYSCRELFNMLTRAYSNFAKSFDVKNIVLLGDASGAGLALSLAMLAWEDGYRKPDQMILLSPMLDTEFFDQELESELKECSVRGDTIFYNDEVKDFLNTYWVKDYAVKTEYTSPYYGDYMDLCDDVVVFTGERDIYHCYAKSFYNKAKQQGCNIRFFQFADEYHNFMMDTKSKKQKLANKYLVDVVNGTYDASVKDLFPIKNIAYWSKHHPEAIKDVWAEKFIYDSKIDFSKIKDKMNEYRRLLMISKHRACDNYVEQFIKKYPECTIVNVGCRLDNMFGRLDNGRINWYNVDTYNTISVRRAMFGEPAREKTIGRNIMDFSWLDEIHCKRNQGLMFVFDDALTTFRLGQIKELFSQIRFMFPAAEVVFTATSQDATTHYNAHFKNEVWSRGRINMSIDDTQKIVFGWRPDYRIMAEEPLMNYCPRVKIKKMRTKFAKKYNLVTYNHKIIHLKLGREEYDISI